MEIQDLKTIAVVGLGKMGVDWVANLLEGSYNVIGYDSSPQCLETTEERLKKGLAWIARKRKSEVANFAEEAYSRFTITDSEDKFVAAARHAQVFLEVVFEDLKLKCDMFARIAPNLSPETIIWTNTSSLSISTMGQASGRSSKFLGTHGMNPVYQMPAVEVIQHPQLDDKVLRFTLDVLTQLGKIPFIAADVPGFWVNKQLVPFMLECMRALERGEITVEEGDKGIKNSLGHPQGVFKLNDFVGNDTCYRVAMAMYLATQDPRYYPPAILTRMFKNKEWGVKTGVGFYEWDGFKPKAPRDFSSQQIKSADTILDV